MGAEVQSTMNFEFGIVGDQLDLSDDEALLAQVSVQAAKVELRRQQEASSTAWRHDAAGQFHWFLKELVGELQPSRDDYQQRLDIVARLSSALDHMDSFRGATLSTFGSFESNFYTRWADLDLSLELPNRSTLLEPVSKKLKIKILNSLLRTLIRKGLAHSGQFIPYARVPLITFEDSRHNVSCDISVDNDAAKLKSRVLRWIGEIDPRCRDLVFLVKCWAKAHGINDPKLGTLNSFALCLLVIFHLQTRSPPVLPPLSAVLDEDIARRSKGPENFTEKALKSYWERIQPFVADKFGAQNKSSVAELFITFFHQFSAVKEFWNLGLAVCTFRGAWGDKSSTCAKWRSKSYMMTIEDPFDRWENCARSVQESTFDSISRAFASTAVALGRPVPSTGLPCLLEALFRWPADSQALGLQAWLWKVHSKTKTAQISRSIMERSAAVSFAAGRVRGKAQAVAAVQHHYHPRNITLEAFLENSIEAQFREQSHFDGSVTAVKAKKKRRKKKLPVSIEAQFREQLHFDHSVTAVQPEMKMEQIKLPVTTEVASVGNAGSNSVSAWRPKNNLHPENRARNYSGANTVKNRPTFENNVEALVRGRPQHTNSVIAGTSEEMKTTNHKARMAKKDSRAQAVKYHPHQLNDIQLDTSHENSVGAPVRKQMHVNHSVIAGTSKEMKTTSCKARTVRKYSGAQAVENHSHQLDNIPWDTSLERSVEVPVRDQPHFSQSVGAGMSKERKMRNHKASSSARISSSPTS